MGYRQRPGRIELTELLTHIQVLPLLTRAVNLAKDRRLGLFTRWVTRHMGAPAERCAPLLRPRRQTTT